MSASSWCVPASRRVRPRASPISASIIGNLEAWIERETARSRASVAARFTGDRAGAGRTSMSVSLRRVLGRRLGLMFVILLAQFNSLYNSVLVLSRRRDVGRGAC